MPRWAQALAEQYEVAPKVELGTGRPDEEGAWAVTDVDRIAIARDAPAGPDGRLLLAHELAHVIQQSAPSGRLRPGGPVTGREAEQEADAAADAIVSGRPVPLLSRAYGPARQERATQSAPLPPAVNQSTVTITKGTGTEVRKAGAKLGKDRQVTVSTDVTVNAGKAGTSDYAYELTYNGSDASEMRWLQFAWREVFPQYDVKGRKADRGAPARGKLEHPPSSGYFYHLTTDPKKPQWNTDTSSSGSPFYEQGTTVNRSANELTMVDFPDPMIWVVNRLLGDPARKPSSVVSHFHATTYLLHGRDVVYRADIDLTWNFTAPDDAKPESAAAASEPKPKPAAGEPKPKPVAAASEPKPKSAVTGGPAKQLESAHRTRLLTQFPDFNLPGPTADAPESQPKFDIVRDLTPAGSLTEAQWGDPNLKDIDKFADIATLADAYNLIDVVASTSATSINLAGHVPGGTVKPGLNYASVLVDNTPTAPGGQTGYIDREGKYHNPDLPVERDGPLPPIAIILGPNAFNRGKAFALATLRHEMEHARHEQLVLGWLVKWRDERPSASFKDWLENQAKAKKLSAVDAGVIEAGTGGTTAGTELLAWTEGLVTSLPFIPAVDDKLIRTSGSYPAAIFALRGAGENFNRVIKAFGQDRDKDKSSSSDRAKGEQLTQAALDRIRDVCCNVLAQPQRDLLIRWIDLLLGLGSRKPPEPEFKEAVADFSPLQDFLTRVRDIARKPCPKGKP